MSSASEKTLLEETTHVMNHFSKTQKTITYSVSVKGIGLHSGQTASLIFKPAPENTGILFRRTDLTPTVDIPAHIDYVTATPRSTNLGHNGATVETVEHVLSAIFALGITNLIIEITGEEVPILDGSALPFLKILEQAQTTVQTPVLNSIKLTQPVYYSSEGTHLVALPSDKFCISYTLDYPMHSWIPSQYYSYELDTETFKHQIAPCRTFCLYDELTFLANNGLIKGGSLECAVVLKEDGVLNKEGLHFDNECVRHKILDLIGDLSLVGKYFVAHVIAIRSGHRSNVAFAKKILNTLKMENS